MARTLWIEESTEPKHKRSTIHKPRGELLHTLQHLREPQAQRHRRPRHFYPILGHAGIVKSIERLLQMRRHNNCAVDSEFEVVEIGAAHFQRHLDPIHFLAEEDVEGLRSALLLNRRLHLEAVKVFGELGEEIVGQSLDSIFTRLTTATVAVFWLNGEDGVEKFLRGFGLRRDVGVGVEPKDVGCVGEWQRVDELAIIVDTFELGDGVGFVELEVVQKHVVAKPHLPVRVQESTVVVVCDATTVVHLAEHVAHGDPLNWRFGLEFVHVVLDKLDGGGEIGLVELVRNVPANRTELATLLHNRVEKGDAVEQRFVLWTQIHVQHVLSEPRVRPLETSAQPLGRLIREFN